jgi:hypothetical protein
MATVGINHASEISVKHVIRSDPDLIREYVHAANPYYSGPKVGFVGHLYAVRFTAHKILFAVITESKQHLETL